MNFGKWTILAAVFVVLAACQTNEDFYGKGPLTLSSSSLAGFERYKKAGINAGYFAVTEDGSTYGYSYCSAGQCGGNSLMVALQSCESHAQRTCKIYAYGPTVVWDHSAPKGSN